MIEHGATEDSALAEDIARYIRDEHTGDFGDLLLRLFSRQYRLNEPYRTYCDNVGQTPANVADWRDIPAVPARAFKIAALSCCPLDEAAAVFHSSGTTEGQTSKHYLDKTAVELYKTSLANGFYHMVPRELPILALMPAPQDAPNSSLSFMLGALGAERFFWGDVEALSRRLSQIEIAGAPVCLFGTAFALLELFDQTPNAQWRLPTGSCVVETGGFKGRTRQVSRQELYGLIAERLRMSAPYAMAEYGMSEMASQYYGTPESGLSGPHWVRARIIDPITEKDSQEGVLRHYDLANWNSVAVIQTQDMARRLPSGAFELLGRALQAELRGCSLSVEERWLSGSTA